MKRLTAFLLIALLLFTACGRTAMLIPAQPETPATVESPSDRAVNIVSADQTAFPTEETATMTASDNTSEESTTGNEASTSVNSTAAAKNGSTTTKATEAAKTTQPGKTTEAQKTTAPKTTEAQKTTAAPKTTAAAKTTETPKTTGAPKTTEAPKTTAPATTAPPTTNPPATKPAEKTCVLRIECKTIQDNLKKLKAGKAAFVPKNGVILEDTPVRLQEGDTVFSVLKRACEEHVCTDNCQYCQKSGIQLEYTFTPVFETYYIEGIHQIYEKDCGTLSGWMFSINGTFPEEGASSIPVSEGDRIVFCFSCDMGDDVGNHFEG